MSVLLPSMSILLLSLSCLHRCTTAPLTPQKSFKSLCDDDDWTVVWSDEFDGDLYSQPDPSKWNIETGPLNGAGKNPSQEATAISRNVWLQNGSLVLQSKREWSGNYAFTTGMVSTKGKAAWKSGRVCVMAKLPGGNISEASGLWPAHWMMPSDSSCWPDHGEIDMMEMINGNGMLHSAYHWSANYPTTCTFKDKQNTVTTQVSDWAERYHEYGVEFDTTKGFARLTLDGQYVNNVTSLSGAIFTPNTAFDLILQTAVGTMCVQGWMACPNGETLKTSGAWHQIDYVRVAQPKQSIVESSPARQSVVEQMPQEQ